MNKEMQQTTSGKFSTEEAKAYPGL